MKAEQALLQTARCSGGLLTLILLSGCAEFLAARVETCSVPPTLRLRTNDKYDVQTIRFTARACGINPGHRASQEFIERELAAMTEGAVVKTANRNVASAPSTSCRSWPKAVASAWRPRNC